jgi:predicted ribosome quality control (RQC) complex YloA/Tae2 family protein
MSLNCNEIDLILRELDIEGSFIQEIVQPSFSTIALYTYKPGVAKTVFVSLAAGECRIHEVRRKIPKNDKPLRFNELLRSRIKGARITGCRQLGHDRIIELKLLKPAPIFILPAANEKFAGKKKNAPQEEFDEEYSLFIRLWSNAGNIFLCDKDNVILDSFYRRPAKGEKTGEVLALPKDAPVPADTGTAVVTGPAGSTDTDASEESEKSLLQKFPVRSFDEFEGSFNEKVDQFYSSNSSKNSLESLLEQAGKWYQSHKSKLEGALERLSEKRIQFQNAEQWKHQGDLILSYANLIQDGAKFLECTDYENGKTVQIKIDPKKSAQQNAADYYATYKKQTSGLDQLEFDIQQTQNELTKLEQQYQNLLAEKNPVKLEQVLRKAQKPRQQEKEERPGLMYEVKGWTIFVGRDAGENDELLRHYVKGGDMWFHTRDYAGGYVFIKFRAGKTIPLDIMLIAGNLAVYHSKARKNGQADLYYTQVKHLRRAKNGPKGLVLPTNEKNLHIKLDEALLRGLNED